MLRCIQLQAIAFAYGASWNCCRVFPLHREGHGCKSDVPLYRKIGGGWSRVYYLVTPIVAQLL
jgi:hypothetical protein